MSDQWTVQQMPRMTGKVVVITGANSGLGLETASALAGKGAHVVLACRSHERANVAMASIRERHEKASLEFMALDLASLESIASFAEAFANAYTHLDVLCNNAGVMALPFRKTADGFEMQIGTNHLGHFALTGHMLKWLNASEAGRVVTVSSLFHARGSIRFDDLNWSSGYSKWPAYGQAKLANLLFAFELQRRLEKSGTGVVSMAAHPGYAATNLQSVGPLMEHSGLLQKVMEWSNTLLAQSAEMGALPSIFACSSLQAQGGAFYGPDGWKQLRGYPTEVGCTRAARSEADASRLWTLSEDLTGVHYLS